MLSVKLAQRHSQSATLSIAQTVNNSNEPHSSGILSYHSSSIVEKKVIALTPEDEVDLSRLNVTKLSMQMIERIGGDFIKLHSEELQKIQDRHLKFVRYSAISKQHQIAASNAIMILKNTRFSFEGISLKGVSIPFADLSRTVLNKVDFTGADLTGVNFLGCSLKETVFRGANFDKVDFGGDPILFHDSQVRQMVFSSDKTKLVTLDSQGLYIWDLKTQQIIRKEPLISSLFPEGSFVVLTQDKKYILRAYFNKHEQNHNNSGIIDFVNVDTLETISSQKLCENIVNFKMFEPTSDDQYIIAYRYYENQSVSPRDSDELEIWALTHNSQGIPTLERRNQRQLERSIRAYSFHKATNCLALRCFSIKNSDTSLELFSIPDLKLVEGVKKKNDWDVILKDYFTGLQFSSQGDSLYIAHLNRIYCCYRGQLLSPPKLLFSEDNPSGSENVVITNLKFFPESSYLAYIVTWRFSNGIYGGKLCIREIANDYAFVGQMEFRMGLERLSSKINVDIIGKKVFYFEQNKVVMINLETITSQGKEFLIDNVRDLRFTSDGKQIAVLHEGTVSQFEIRGGELLSKSQSLGDYGFANYEYFFLSDREHEQSLSLYKFSADVTFLFEEQYSNGNGCLCISNVETGKIYRKIESSFLAYAATMDNQGLVFLYKSGLELWDIETGKRLGFANFFTPIEVDHKKYELAISMTVSPYGHVVVNLDGNVSLYSIEWGSSSQIHEIIRFKINHSVINEVKFIKESLFFVDQNDFVCFDIKTCIRKKLSLFHQDNIYDDYRNVFGFDLSHDAKYLITTTTSKTRQGGRVALWNLEQTKELDVLYTEVFQSRFSSDGYFVVCWHSKKFCVYKIVNDHFVLQWQKPQRLEMSNADLTDIKNLSPNNRRLLEQMNSS